MFGVQTLLATVFYLSGYLCKKLSIQLKLQYILFLLVPALAACTTQLSMHVNSWFVLLEYAIAMFSIFAILSLSGYLSKLKTISSTIAYIGNQTLYILIFHFLSFKIVSAIYLYINGLPIDRLSEFPVLKESNSWLWMVYCLCGVILPLLIWKFQNSVRDKKE